MNYRSENYARENTVAEYISCSPLTGQITKYEVDKDNFTIASYDVTSKRLPAGVREKARKLRFTWPNQVCIWKKEGAI